MLGALEIVVIEFAILSIVCGILLKYYRSPSVPIDVLFSVYASWVLGFATVLILPYDLSQAIVSGNHDENLAATWKTIYWITFILAWVILPIQMEFHSSGHFTFKEKLMDALKNLLWAGLIALVCGLAYFIYMVAMNHLSFTEVMGFTMAMSNTYGVLLIAVLMGSGLAGVPKRLWAIANGDLELKRLYVMATAIEDNFQDARFELEDCELEVDAIVQELQRDGQKSLRSDIGAFVTILETRLKEFKFRDRSSSRLHTSSMATRKKVDVSNLQYSDIVKLHSRLIRSQEKADANQRRWESLVTDIRRMQGSYSSGNETVESSTLSLLSSSMLRKREVYTFICKFASICAAFFSILILWCELLMASSIPSPLGWIMSVFNGNNMQPTMIQGVAFVAISYMSLCTYWPLFRLNIGWSYRLQGPQLSPFSSLIFNAEYLSRLQFALGYNFLLCINMTRTQTTAFNGLMENIDIVPVFGASFTIYIPVLMILVAITTLFDGFARFLAFLGIESEESIIIRKCCGGNEFELDSVLLEKYNHGKMLVEHELNMANLRSSSNDYSLRKDTKANGMLKSVGEKLSIPFLQPSSNQYSKLENTSSLHGDEELQIQSATTWQPKRNGKVSSNNSERSHPIDPNDSLNKLIRNPVALLTKDKSENKREYSYFNIDDNDESDEVFRGRYAD